MKTTEEIKKGLECCDNIDEDGLHCEECPYRDGDDCIYLNSDTLALIQQLEAQVPKWISVKERLPEKSGYYLCWMPKYEIMEKLSYSAKHMAFNAFDTENIPESALTVTHWMPLPGEPKGD